MEKEKQKRAMLAGIAAMALFMIGDWLLDVKGSGNKEVGLFVNSNWPAMSMWRFEVSILLAAAATLPFPPLRAGLSKPEAWAVTVAT